MSFEHRSVLLRETVDSLNIRPDGIYVDGTLGGGGHAEEVLRRLSEKGRLVGIDQDEDAIEAACGRLKGFGNRFTAVRSNYCDIAAVLSGLAIDAADGIYLDLGVSSYQLDTSDRGFTYRDPDAPLDMRMDRRKEVTAADILNTYSKADLIHVLRDYGEEQFAANIAKHIVMRREEKPFAVAGDLLNVIQAAIPARIRFEGGHPAKRTFQALRIEVNGELFVLQNTLDVMIGLLKPGGRLSVITFHSLEDRIVKDVFKRNQFPCTCPREFPVCVCGKKPTGRVITKKPILPSAGECEENSRSKSAKLRVFEKT